MLEANAAMKSMVRRDTDEDWKSYIRRLMHEEGVIDRDDDPTDDDLRRFDRRRKGKKVSNKDWKSDSDDDARIVKMKDGRTHFGYKAEHVVDLETEVVLSSRVCHGTAADTSTLSEAMVDAQLNLIRSDSDVELKAVAADKGYHSNTQVTDCTHLGLTTYIPEPTLKNNRTWSDKPSEVKTAVLNNRRRTRRRKGRRLQRLRSERVERSFAHVCDSGGARRTWLRGLRKITKRYSLVVAAHNLGLIMRKLFGSGKPRQFASNGRQSWLCSALLTITEPTFQILAALSHATTSPKSAIKQYNASHWRPDNLCLSTAC
ncbi:MAG: transposase [Planctomycetaceae bacterium]|nr:transposase [Planctomycetaceae bacterium]